MANYNAISESVMERALKLATALSRKEVADALGLSYPSAVKIIAADKAAKEGNLEQLEAVGSRNIIEWAAKRNGIELAPPAPAPVETAPAPEKKPEEENAALAVVKVLTALDNILCGLSEINSTLHRMSGRLANIEAATGTAVTQDALNANVNLLLDAIGGQ